MAYEELKAIAAEWRSTAAIWEAESKSYWPSAKTDPMPPSRGRANIVNWVNWLNGCAKQVEDAVAKLEAQ